MMRYLPALYFLMAVAGAGGQGRAAISDAYLQYVHPTVREPFVDGVNLTVAAELGDPCTAALGLVNVTKAPFHADPSGRRDATKALQQAIDFTGDHERYGHFMRRVVLEWSRSTENALTDPHINRRAWVGHAACALAFRCPEDVVRQAWGYLTDEQKYLANQAADRAIVLWRNRYVADKGMGKSVGQSVLFPGTAG